MSLILLLPILVSGFIYCNFRYTQFIKLHRFQGQHLYLKSVKYGLFIVVTTSFIIATITHLFPAFSSETNSFLKKHIAPFVSNHSAKDLEEITAYAKVTVLSILFAYLQAIFLNFLNIITKVGIPLPESVENDDSIITFFKKWWSEIQYSWLDTKILLSCDILSDSPLDKFFIDSYPLVQEILISTDSGKVYVGFISDLAEPNEKKGIDQEIKIIPTCSGYRDPETHKVVFNTYYPEEDENSYVIIKQDLIVSASPFRKETYDEVYKTKSFYDDLSA